MRAGADRLTARVVQVFGAAQAHHGYLFANARGTRMKLIVHDGFGVWCARRRLNQGRFIWPSAGAPLQPRLSKSAMAELAGQMLDRFAAMEALLEARDTQAAAQAQLIKFKDAQLERITLELARLNAWKFGARAERMNAEQRQMFEEPWPRTRPAWRPGCKP